MNAAFSVLSLNERANPAVRVAIVGGGIGGMTLALSLFDAGIDHVDIYEPSPAVKGLGAGIARIRSVGS
jgi:2-polyprenyl-6-methoxyphenol hydroxylase-like FAD-dependent oxidoreductase